MADQDGRRTCCSWCFSLIFTAGFACLFLWLALRSDKPKCSIEYFYVPALNKSLDSRLNTSLNFMVQLANPNKDQGIYYDDLLFSFSNTNSSVANFTVPRFYQGHKKKAHKSGQALPFNNHTVLGPLFRMDLKTHVRFKIIFWRTKRYAIEVGADFEVNGDGVKANAKGIEMKKSDSSSSLRSYLSISVLMNLFIFFAIHL